MKKSLRKIIALIMTTAIVVAAGCSAIWAQTVSMENTIVYGDVDDNGKVSVSDALAVLKYVVGSKELDAYHQTVADVDGSGKVNVRDALLIMKHVVGSIDHFPVEDMEPVETPEPTPTPEPVLYGDPTGDGKVNTADALAVLKHVVGSETLSEDKLKAADVNGDGTVNVDDALLILKKIAGNITSFPVES